jgi:LysR family transcriptional regulator, benzoate and cis,cis-muconate-responsive activator of ben and cat genes
MLLPMELRQLRYFVAVAEETNISRAAQKIFLTQPALSRQIKALEDEIGQCLLERHPHSISLTPAGTTLLREARDFLKHADELLERVRSSAQTVRLRVGYAPSLASGLLSGAIENFAQKHPRARVELFDLSTKEMLAGLKNDTLDVVLTVGVDRDGHGFTWTPLLRVPWQLAVNRQHPLARRPTITPEEVAREPLLVFCQNDYPEYWHTVMDWLRQHRQRPSISGEYDGVNSLLSAVESGLGVALVTTSSARLIPERVRLKPLTAAPKPLCIAAGHRITRAVEKPLSVFIEELRLAGEAIQVA